MLWFAVLQFWFWNILASVTISSLELFDFDFFGRSRLLIYFCVTFICSSDALVYLLCLASRATCCCVFELIFEIPAHFPYQLVSCFSLGCCRAVCLVALVIILQRIFWEVLVLGCGWVVFSWYCINSFGIFFSSLVSATSSYVDDVAHT